MHRQRVSHDRLPTHRKAAGTEWTRTASYALAILIASVASVLPQPLTAQGIAEFYSGRVVTMIVGSSTGGGYDLNARIVAEHLRKHIPGNPSVLVKNVPGAGGLKAAGYMYAVAPRDGSELAILQRNLTIEPLFTKQPYDGTRFSWLGSASKDVSLCISSNISKFKTFGDLRTRQSIAAGQSSGSDFRLLPRCSRIFST